MKLRPYQNVAVLNLLKDLNVGKKKLGAILPTGSGKTVIMMDVCNTFIKTYSNKNVLILSHLDILTSQTSKRFSQHYPGLSVGILQGSTFPNFLDDIVISTMQSARVEEKIEKFRKRAIKEVGLIIVDECHYILTESYQTILSFFPDVPVIGFTATPFREARLMTDYFDSVSYSVSLQELIKDDYLVPPVLNEIKKNPTDLEDTMAMVGSIYKEKEKGNKAIIFMNSIEDAKAMRNVLIASGINARAITSEITGETRDESLFDYQYGSTDVLTTVNVLTAGFDAPCTEAIFMPYGTKSPTTYMQRIGRGLRPFEGKKSCRVYMFGDTPTIKKGFYRMLNDMVLKGADDFKRETVFDDLDWMNFAEDVNREKYEWTQEICKTVKQMENMGLESVSNLLAHKKFPIKFMKDITTLKRYITVSNDSSKDPMTYQQKKILKQQGFKIDDIGEFTKSEASDLIATLSNYHNRYKIHPEFKYQMTEGLHKGKHPRDLPGAYRGWLMSKGKYTTAAREYFKWWHEEGKFERDKK